MAHLNKEQTIKQHQKCIIGKVSTIPLREISSKEFDSDFKYTVHL